MSRSVQTPSKAFAFPNEWLPVRLGSIGKTYGGLTGKSGEDFNTGSASYVTFMQVMGNSRLREPAKGTVNIKSGERQNHVQKDDLLFNGSSETPEEVALAAAVDFHPDSDTFLNSFCFGFRLLPDAPADSLYLAYLFRSSVGRNLVSSLAQGATRYNISKTQLLNQAIHLPSKAEQIAIREKLTDAEELIKSLERLISKKQSIKQGMMQELLTGNTRLSGFTSKWESKTIGQLCVSIRGGGTPSKAIADYWGGQIPWATVKDLSNFNPKGTLDHISTRGVAESAARVVPAGELIVSVRMLIARAVQFSVDVAINQDLKVLNLKQEVDPTFLRYWFNLNEESFARAAGGSTVSGISTTELASKIVDLPPIEEQAGIAHVLQDADEELNALMRRLQSARNVKDGMMQELLTGRTRLPVEEISS